MNFLDDAKSVISEILSTKKSYISVFKKYLKTNIRSSKDCDSIRLIYLIFFKKYYYYEALTEEILGKRTDVLVSFVGVSMVAVKYLKLNVNQVLNFLVAGLEKNKAYSEANEEIFRAILTGETEGREYKLTTEFDTVRRLSVFFNLPIWFVKMMINQFKKEEQVKAILESFIGSYDNVYLQNALVGIDSLDKEELTKFRIKSNGNYVTEEKYSPLINNFAFVETYDYFKEILNISGRFNNKYVTFYSAEKNNLYFEFLNTVLYRNNVINIGIKSFELTPQIVKAVSSKHIQDLSVYEATEGQMIAKLSGKQDFMMYCPKSSNVMDFYLTPESRVIFNPMQLDTIINNELNGLLELSRHCDKGGILTYVVTTVNKRETEEVVKKFLEYKNEFRLIVKKELLPNSEAKQIGYYAIFKKVN